MPNLKRHQVPPPPAHLRRGGTAVGLCCRAIAPTASLRLHITATAVMLATGRAGGCFLLPPPLLPLPLLLWLCQGRHGGLLATFWRSSSLHCVQNSEGTRALLPSSCAHALAGRPQKTLGFLVSNLICCASLFQLQWGGTSAWRTGAELPPAWPPWCLLGQRRGDRRRRLAVCMVAGAAVPPPVPPLCRYLPPLPAAAAACPPLHAPLHLVNRLLQHRVAAPGQWRSPAGRAPFAWRRAYTR